MIAEVVQNAQVKVKVLHAVGELYTYNCYEPCAFVNLVKLLHSPRH